MSLSKHYLPSPTDVEDPLIPPKTIGVLVTKQVGNSLKQFMTQNYDEFMRLKAPLTQEYLKLNKTLFDHKLRHTDIHFGNIVIDRENMKLFYIDVDLKRLEDIQDWSEWKNKLLRDWDYEVNEIQRKLFCHRDEEDEDE